MDIANFNGRHRMYMYMYVSWQAEGGRQRESHLFSYISEIILQGKLE